MENLQPIFSKMKETEIEGIGTVDFLKKLEACVPRDIHWSVSLMYFSISEVKSLTTGIEQATSRGTLVRFFNSTDDASSLKSHNDKLDRIINEATVSWLVIDCQWWLTSHKACWCYGCPGRDQGCISLWLYNILVKLILFAVTPSPWHCCHHRLMRPYFEAVLPQSQHEQS